MLRGAAYTDIISTRVAPPLASPDLRRAWDSLRACRFRRGNLKGQVRHALADAIADMASETPVVEPLPGAVSYGVVSRELPGGDLTLRMLAGNAIGHLPSSERIRAKWPAGRLRPGDRVWVAVSAVEPGADGGPLQLTVSQRAQHVPAGVLAHVAAHIEHDIKLQVLERIPGRRCVVAAISDDVADPVAMLSQDDGAALRRAGAALRGERITLVRG